MKEKEMTAEEIKTIAKDMQKEKITNIKEIKNISKGKHNKEMKQIKGFPIKKKGFIFKKRKHSKTISWKDELDNELLKEKPDLERIKKLRKKHKEKGDIEELPLKSPIMELIKADGSTEWFEGVKAGILEIRRSDEKLAYINLDKGKLLTDETRNVDESVIQKWVVFENDHAPLPTNTFMDSHKVYSNYEEIMTNRKDVQTERIKARGDLVWKIMIPIAIILALIFIGIPLLTGSDIGEVLNLPTAEEKAILECRAYTAGLGQITSEEAQIISQFRIDTSIATEG